MSFRAFYTVAFLLRWFLLGLETCVVSQLPVRLFHVVLGRHSGSLLSGPALGCGTGSPGWQGPATPRQGLQPHSSTRS